MSGVFRSPRPLRAPQNSYYDPENMILRYGDGRGAVDRTPDGFRQHWLSFAHEQCHYLALTGTTFGCFLALLRHDRLFSGLEWLHDMPSAAKEEMIRARRCDDGRPIVEMARSPNKKYLGLAASPTNQPEAADIMRQILFDSFFTWNVFYDLESLGEIACHRDPREVIALALRDACLRSKKVHRVDQPALAQTLAGIGPTGSKALGTREVLEGAAVANELIFLYVAGAPATTLVQRFQELQRSSYFTALKRYMRALHRDLHDILAHPLAVLPLFLVLCDLALNPLLPPFAMRDPKPLAWEDVYPPVRLMRLLDDINSSDLERIDETTISTPGRLHQEIDRIAARSRFASPTQFSFPGPSAEVRDALRPMFHEAYARPPGVDAQRIGEILNKGITAYEYRSWLEASAWRLRSDDPVSVILPSYYLASHSHFAGDRPGLIMLPGRFGGGLVYPPLVYEPKTDELQTVSGVDPNFGYCLTIELLREHLMHELLFAVGRPTLGPLPERSFPREGTVFKGLTDWLVQVGKVPEPW